LVSHSRQWSLGLWHCVNLMGGHRYFEEHAASIFMVEVCSLRKLLVYARMATTDPAICLGRQNDSCPTWLHGVTTLKTTIWRIVAVKDLRRIQYWILNLKEEQKWWHLWTTCWEHSTLKRYEVPEDRIRNFIVWRKIWLAEHVALNMAPEKYTQNCNRETGRKYSTWEI
jgi:hypothetical protein